ncbi:hypothetical protein V2V90_21390 [Agrobacterium leguminum]|uniref:hypothetical protein n=1 Tax=Rhizobium/Agrobacterium group TaxID=227290 RepID=UPI001A98D7BE|nr:hypothetical protein [Rhizobium sp. ZX09]QSZ57718.1 hypothetical protein BTN45_11845 [Rhizobium sp. ZX09]
MTDGCIKEFETVSLILRSSCESRGVDGFCLAWIKLERQLRKLAANIVYQASTVRYSDQACLRKALYDNAGLSHRTFMGAIHHLSGMSVKDLIGERYRTLKNAVDASYSIRQKIFHGQQTEKRLGREALIGHIDDVREWCGALSDASMHHFGYDGFSGTTSLFKTNKPELIAAVDKALQPKGWEEYVKTFQR